MDPITISLVLAVLLTSGDTASAGRGHVYAGHAVRAYRRGRKAESLKQREARRKDRAKRLRKTRIGRYRLWVEAAARSWLVSRRAGLKAVRTEWPSRHATYAARREAAAHRRARIRARVQALNTPRADPEPPTPVEGPQPTPDEGPQPTPDEGSTPDPGGAGHGPADPPGAPQAQTPLPPKETGMAQPTPNTEAHSLGAWIKQWESLLAAANALTESGATHLKLHGAAIAPASDVIDHMESALNTFRTNFAGLIEAADLAPEGTGHMTVAQARTE